MELFQSLPHWLIMQDISLHLAWLAGWLTEWSRNFAATTDSKKTTLPCAGIWLHSNRTSPIACQVSSWKSAERSSYRNLKRQEISLGLSLLGKTCKVSMSVFSVVPNSTSTTTWIRFAATATFTTTPIMRLLLFGPSRLPLLHRHKFCQPTATQLLSPSKNLPIT